MGINIPIFPPLGTFGTNGDDYMLLLQGGNVYGLGGNDTIIAYEWGSTNVSGGSGDDWIRGSRMADTLSGDSGNDTINGNAGDDLIKGGDGNDVLDGSRGDDELHGGIGDDIVNGGVENDDLWGDAGKDVFVFGINAGDDTIHDFQDGTDRIDLSYYNLNAPPPMFNDGAGNVLLDLGGGNTVKLLGVNSAQLTASDFIF